MGQQAEAEKSNNDLIRAAADLGIPQEFIRNQDEGLGPMERFLAGHNEPRYHPAQPRQPQQQQQQQQPNR